MPNRQQHFLKLRADIISNFKLSEKQFNWLFASIVNGTGSWEDVAQIYDRHFKSLTTTSRDRIYRIAKKIKRYLELIEKENNQKVGVAFQKKVITPI